MGDRTITIKKCHKCGNDYEEYDAPTCMMFVGICDCGWKDKRKYYKTGKNEITLK